MSAWAGMLIWFSLAAIVSGMREEDALLREMETAIVEDHASLLDGSVVIVSLDDENGNEQIVEPTWHLEAEDEGQEELAEAAPTPAGNETETAGQGNETEAKVVKTAATTGAKVSKKPIHVHIKASHLANAKGSIHLHVKGADLAKSPKSVVTTSLPSDGATPVDTHKKIHIHVHGGGGCARCGAGSKAVKFSGKAVKKSKKARKWSLKAGKLWAARARAAQVVANEWARAANENLAAIVTDRKASEADEGAVKAEAKFAALCGSSGQVPVHVHVHGLIEGGGVTTSAGVHVHMDGNNSIHIHMHGN
jgi:hypothetical protein